MLKVTLLLWLGLVASSSDALRKSSTRVYSSLEDGGHVHEDNPVLRDVENYELHDFSNIISSTRRRLGAGDSEALKLDILGRSLSVNLKRDTELFGTNYKHSFLDENGKEVKSEAALDCFYQATFGDDMRAKGAFALCDEHRVLATVFGDVAFTIEPVTVREKGRNTMSQVHAVYLHEDLRTNVANMSKLLFPPQVVSGGDTSLGGAKSVGGAKPLGDGAFANAVAAGTFTDSSTKYVGMLVVNDNAYFKTNGAQTQVKAAQVIAAAKAYYDLLPNNAPYQINLGIAKMATFMTKDPYNAGYTSSGTIQDSPLLGIFGTWLQSSNLDADAAILLVGTKFTTAAGWGFVGTVCDRTNRWNVAEVDATISGGSIGAVAAHEIGHILGSQHDDQTVPSLGHNCNSNPGIMGRRLQTTQFSPCTIEWWRLHFTPSGNAYNTADNPACLERPDYNTPSGPVCGDGLVEGNEECDCVGKDCSNNPCCDGSTCRLKAGATCAAHQSCCDSSTCAPKSAGSVCRASTGQCDIAETCDGQTPSCPADVRKPIGTSCTRTIIGNPITGTCTCAGCMSLTEKCRLSDVSYVAPCSWMSTGDDACDTIWCQDSGGNCSGYMEPTTTGMSCGAGKACMNKKCVAASSVTCANVIFASSSNSDQGSVSDSPTVAPSSPPTFLRPTTAPTTKRPTKTPTTKSPVPPTYRRRRYKKRRGLDEEQLVEEVSA